MYHESLSQKSVRYLGALCNEVPGRSVGSAGNQASCRYIERQLRSFDWNIELQEFDAVDWMDGGASLTVQGKSFDVFPSPYANGCDVVEQLVCVSSVGALEVSEIGGKIVLLHGEIAKEQLMPKNFVFYNPEEHQHIIALLEKGSPEAIICVTGRNASLAGGVYPFPLIEDGDFDIPSVFMTEEEGTQLLPFEGDLVRLKSISHRVPGKGWNVVARKGSPSGRRIVITAHIDAKKGTPGAIDNATGVVVLLLLGELLAGYQGRNQLEMVALNGEDYYAVPGQMCYIEQNENAFEEILLNINIDGAGFKEGKTAFSFYGLPEEVEARLDAAIAKFGGVIRGPQWFQGDHSIFIQNGRPAVAVSSAWFTEHIDEQDITHTAKDTVDIVDCDKLVEIALAVQAVILALDTFVEGNGLPEIL